MFFTKLSSKSVIFSTCNTAAVAMVVVGVVAFGSSDIMLSALDVSLLVNLGEKHFV